MVEAAITRGEGWVVKGAGRRANQKAGRRHASSPKNASAATAATTSAIHRSSSAAMARQQRGRKERASPRAIGSYLLPAAFVSAVVTTQIETTKEAACCWQRSTIFLCVDIAYCVMGRRRRC